MSRYLTKKQCCLRRSEVCFVNILLANIATSLLSTSDKPKHLRKGVFFATKVLVDCIGDFFVDVSPLMVRFVNCDILIVIKWSV